MKPRSCELCTARASVYCDSDSAFLCAECDDQVHAANFLAGRHVRTPIDSTCESEQADDTASSSVRSAASSCVSTAESALASTASRNTRKPRSSSSTIKSPNIAKATDATTGEVDARAEGILAAWCARLQATGGGITGTASNCDAVVAAHAMGVGLRRFGAAVPPRICAAAAVWLAFKLCRREGGSGGLNQKITRHQYLRRLEDCSGVPARIIAAAESRLSRLVRNRQRDDAEGWAEC